MAVLAAHGLFRYLFSAIMTFLYSLHYFTGTRFNMSTVATLYCTPTVIIPTVNMVSCLTLGTYFYAFFNINKAMTYRTIWFSCSRHLSTSFKLSEFTFYTSTVNGKYLQNMVKKTPQ